MATSDGDLASVMEDRNTTSQNDIFYNHRELVDWITKGNDGYLHPDVRIAHSTDKGFYMTVAHGKTIQALTRVTSSPMTATLSVLNAFDIAPFRSHGSTFPATFLQNNVTKPELLQTFFLMEQYVLGEKSWWSPYIRTLPTVQDINDRQFDSRQDQIWLEGTNLKAALISQNTKWQEMYTKGLRELKILNWQPALDGSVSWELFRWASTIFGSRSFTSEVLTDTEPADQARMEGRNGVKKSEHTFLKPLFTERFAVLLPLLDILNHRPIAQVEWQARCTFVGMQVLTSFTSGEELCNNYGPRDNETLLLSYGFTILDNPFDHVAIALKPPPPGSPLATARKEWKQDPRSTLDHRSYIFSISHPRATVESSASFESSIFSYDLLDTLSILKGNDRELQTMYILRQTLLSSSLVKPHKFDDFRNLLAVLSQLHLDCKARAERLRSTLPQGDPQSSKQRNAKVYRDRQLTIAETATALCKLVLTRACSDQAQASILADVARHISVQAFYDSKELLKRHSLITRPNELLTFKEAMGFLPDNQIITLKNVMTQIEGHLTFTHSQQERDISTTPPPSLPLDPLNPTKISLALLLATFLHLYQTGIPLPLRLRSWLDQLTSWYPPDDENWSYVPTSGPWAVGEEPPLGLMELLDARRGIVEEFNGRKGGDLLGEDGEQESNLEEAVKGLEKLNPRMICWAWNVMEEEGVVVSREIVEGIGSSQTEGADGAGVGVEFLLYCKA